MVLRALIRASQNTMFGPFTTPQTFELARDDGGLASAVREHEDGAAFFTHFDGELRPGDLSGAEVLDLGSGYGGRTVHYAEQGAAMVTGIEISDAMVARSERFARSRGASNVRFLRAFAERLPFADDSFDVVISYDVLEHVQDPVLAFRELRRVLRSGGHAWLVFPTFLGARASHLDYLTQIPLLHRIFDPDVVIDVVNEFLESRPELGVARQPHPSVGPLGRRALPSVNGMSRREALALIERNGFRVHLADACPFITRAAPGAIGCCAPPLEWWARRAWPPDVLIGSLRFHLSAP
jgi:SAM-dependent methyltransferase